MNTTTKASCFFLAMVVLISSSLPASQILYTCRMSGRQHTSCCCKDRAKSTESSCAGDTCAKAVQATEPACGGQTCSKPAPATSKELAADDCGCCSITQNDQDSGPAGSVDPNSSARPVTSDLVSADWEPAWPGRAIVATQPTTSPPPICESPPAYLVLLRIRR